MALLALTACVEQTEPRTQLTQYAEVQALADTITALGPAVDASEAFAIAQSALSYSLEQRRLYGVSTPALTHNILVNSGLKERGLCHHWADDLRKHLRQLDVGTVVFQRVLANHVNSWRIEHSALVVTLPRQGIEGGVVLDGWRDGGDLFWSAVEDDPRYDWVEIRQALAEKRAARKT